MAGNHAAEKLSLLQPPDDPALPWLGTLVGLPILGLYYWTMSQYVAQHLLGARSVEAATRGALIAATLNLLPLFLMGLAARSEPRFLMVPRRIPARSPR